MVIMALDHTRDFFSNSANLFDPTDLTHTSPMLFFTRWITHFCAPVFVFLAGAGAYLSLTKGKDECELSKVLITRGVWLIFLELFVISPLGWSLSLSFAFTRLQVIWVIGISMVILGGLILVWPSRPIAGLGVAMILGHDLFDGPHAAWLGEAAGPWGIAHQIQFFTLWHGHTVASLYPLIPWIGVMMAGYGFGELLTFKKSSSPVGRDVARRIHDRWIRLDTRLQSVWRPVPLVISRQLDLHCDVVSPLQQLSAVAALRHDDTRSRPAISGIL